MENYDIDWALDYLEKNQDIQVGSDCINDRLGWVTTEGNAFNDLFRVINSEVHPRHVTIGINNGNHADMGWFPGYGYKQETPYLRLKAALLDIKAGKYQTQIEPDI